MAKFFLFPFAEDGDKTAIPDDTQPSGSVSYETGFGIDYQKDLATDPTAKPIPRNQFNQLMFDVTNALRQYQTLGVPDFITNADNGGVDFPYDIYARVRYDDGVNGFQLYESLETANVALPSDLTKWRIVSNNLQGIQAGTIIDWAGPIAPSGYINCDGSAIVRATYPQLFDNITQIINGTLTNGNPSVTGLSSTLTLHVGMALEGTGIAPGTTILTIDSGTAITLSANATAGGASDLTFFLWGNGNGTTTFNVPDLRRRTTIGNGGTPSTDPLGIGNRVGQVGGEEGHVQSEAELHAHQHVSNGILTQTPPGTQIQGGTNWQENGTSPTSIVGSSQAFNIIQPSAVTYKCIKT